MPADSNINMKNLKNRKLYMQVYDEIRDYIFQQQLRPGDKLPTEIEMCASLGVSRNVLREAVKALEITGIVASKPGVGIIIQEFNPDFLFQTLFYNLTLDSTALLKQTLAVRKTLELGFMKESFSTLQPEDIQNLRQQVSIMQKISDEKTALNSNRTGTFFGPEFSKADAEFHRILYLHVDNIILLSIINAIWSCDKFHKQTVEIAYMQNTVNKHKQILEALEQKDYDAFSAAMHFHFNDKYKNEIF